MAKLNRQAATNIKYKRVQEFHKEVCRYKLKNSLCEEITNSFFNFKQSPTNDTLGKILKEDLTNIVLAETILNLDKQWIKGYISEIFLIFK